MSGPRLKAVMRQVVLPLMVLVGLDLLVGIASFGEAQAIWFFKNTKNWVQMAAELTFAEAVVCFIIAGLTGVGVSEHSAVVLEAVDGLPVDMKQYEAQREQSIGLGLQLAAIGVLLVAFMVVLTVLS